jgi:hypothetical protein
VAARKAGSAAPRTGCVDGGRVNGGRVNGGRVNGGRVNGGRVNGGRVNGGRVNGGRVNGGRVNGGRVNGGRVNGGRVNGGRVNGGRVNGGRVNGGRGYLPATAAQARRARFTSISVAALVTVLLFSSLVLLVPSGTGPTGPQVDGSIDDWADTGALFYMSPQGPGGDPALDLRQYAIRAEGATNLWFTAQAGGDFFTRAGAAPARGDVLLLLIDVDGSSSTGYAYGDLGADRLVEVAGWNGALRSSGAKAFGQRPAYDWAGFEPAGAVQVAVSGDRMEGLVTGLTGLGPQTRAAFELRGVSSLGLDSVDAPAGPATLRDPGIAARVRPVATGLIPSGVTAPSPMLLVTLENPSPQALTVSGLRATAKYAPQAPVALATGSVWRDANGNGVVDAGSDTKLVGTAVPLVAAGPTALTFDSPVAVPQGGSVSLIVGVETAPTSVAAGTSILLSMTNAADVVAGASTKVSLRAAAPFAGAHPGSYVGAPPTTISVDGIPTDWDATTGVTDPAGDVGAGSVDLTGAKGNASGTTVSFLVTFSTTPLAGAIIPAKLPPTQQLPGGGGGGPPGANPPNPGSDFLFVMFDADNDSATGYAAGGRGYDFALRVDGKDGQPLPGAQAMRWTPGPNPSWSVMPNAPAIGFGSTSVELSVTLQATELTARNVAATAYSTSWEGVRDDLDTGLVFGYDQGTRGGPLKPGGSGVSVGEPTLWPPGEAIPEFQDVAVPVAGAALLFLVGRRRARKPAAG